MAEQNEQAPKLKARTKATDDKNQTSDESNTGTAGPAAGSVEQETKPPVVEEKPVVEEAAAEKPAAPAPAAEQAKAAPQPLPPPQAEVAPVVPGFDKHVAEVAAKLGADAVELIDVIVPKAFKLTLDNHLVLHFHAGIQAVHKFVVDHWYAKANGMKEYVRPQGNVPGLTQQVYEDAIKRVRSGDIKLAYAITNIAAFYKVSEESVRTELDKLLAS